MNKCPSCKLENVLFIDSSKDIRIETDIKINEFEEWEEYECQDCGASLLVENGYITVRRFDFAKFQYKTLMKYSIHWEKKLEEVFNEL
jgi:transposase-like protein